jgi:hypothetical protein
MKQPLNPKWHRLWLLLRRWERCQESFTTDSLGSSGPHGRFGSITSFRVGDVDFRFTLDTGRFSASQRTVETGQK